jgi:PHD/YefM family antitoxin component YafN of YafNO toxin-antitoxin module
MRAPVAITQRNKPRLVLLNINDYKRLVERGDTRKAGTIETMSDQLFEDVTRVLAEYERESEPE